MGAFIFIVRQSGGTWTAKQHGGGGNALEASSASTLELQQKLTSMDLGYAGASAVLSSSLTLVTPTSAIAQVTILSGGGVSVGSSGTLPATYVVPAPEAPPDVDKKEDDEEDSDYDDNLEHIFGPGTWEY